MDLLSSATIPSAIQMDRWTVSRDIVCASLSLIALVCPQTWLKHGSSNIDRTSVGLLAIKTTTNIIIGIVQVYHTSVFNANADFGSYLVYLGFAAKGVAEHRRAPRTQTSDAALLKSGGIKS